MNELAWRKASCWAIGILLLLTLQEGCGQSEPITSWDSPRLLKVQKDWESLLEIATKTPLPEREEKYGGKNEKLDPMLDDILKNNLSMEDLRHLAATCGTLPVREKDQSAFIRLVLGFMVRAFTEEQDRDNLLKVLSTRCPDGIYLYEPIEFYLAYRAKDISILGEAYSKCQIPEVRRHIALAIRRGFTSMGVRGKDDAEFVSKAMQLYENRKGELIVNPAYRVDAVLPLYDEEDPLWGNPAGFEKGRPLYVESDER